MSFFMIESTVNASFNLCNLPRVTLYCFFRFIKFACNQERIPQTCPCRDGGADTAHVPPYPMKIAPPDGPGVYLIASTHRLK